MFPQRVAYLVGGLFLILAGCRARTDVDALDAVHRAAHAVLASTEGAVTLAEYGLHVEHYAAVLASAERLPATAFPRPLLERHHRVQQTYADALSLWAIEEQGHVFLDDAAPEVASILQRHSRDVSRASHPLRASTAILVLWREARLALLEIDQANGR